MPIKRAIVEPVRRNARAIVFVCVFTCVCAAAGAGYLYYKNPARQGALLAITPKTGGRPDVSAEAIEEINAEKFAVTYACRERAQASAVNKKQAVTLISTNYSYVQVTQLMMLSGAFFTAEHYKRQAAVAVVNERAAFDLFGSMSVAGGELSINSVKYTVVGVIDDEDADGLNVYTPETLQRIRADELMVRLDDRVTEAYVRSELGQAGVTEEHYEFTR